MKNRLVSAPNTEPSVYFLLEEKGYRVSVKDSFWFAENKIAEFLAEDLLSLAGLILLHENKGSEWRVEDEKIDVFLDKFYHE